MKQVEDLCFDEYTVRKNTYEFVEHVEEMLDLMANVLDENCDQARAVLLMFPSSIMLSSWCGRRQIHVGCEPMRGVGESRRS